MKEELEKKALHSNGVFNFDDDDCSLELELSYDDLKLLDQVSGENFLSSEDDFFHEQELMLGKSYF